MYSTNTDTSMLDVETADSVTRYQGGGQSLPDDYFDGKHYSHLLEERYNVLTYKWSYNDLNESPNIKQYADLSEKVVSVSYTCDSSSNIKTSASLILYVPIDDDFWYSNKIYDIGIGEMSDGGHSDGLIMWEPQIYHISQLFIDKTNGDYSIRNANYVRDLGFFIPNNTSYTYDNTTSQLTLQLENLSYMMTAEGGGTLATILRSADYYYNGDYNNNPRKIQSYYSSQQLNNDTSSATNISTSGNSTTNNSTIMNNAVVWSEQKHTWVQNKDYDGDPNDVYNKKTTVVQIPKMPSQQNSERDYLIKQEENAYEQAMGVGAYISGTAEVLYPNVEKKKTIHTPLPISISGEDGFGSYKIFSGGDIARIIYKITRCATDVILNNFYLPLTGFITPHQDAENIAKSSFFPNGWEFDNGANMMDIAETILKDRYYEPMIWVDENRKLCIDTVPPYKNKSRQVLYYSYYGELVISEDISVNDNEFYDVVEVYGKDGEYYGIADASFQGFKTGMGSVPALAYASSRSIIPKVKTINDDSLESDDDCYSLAQYEVWKSSRGNTTISVKLRDNCIKGFVNVSHVVGCAFVEYKTLQGNGKTILCVLKKASLNGGVWTWELEPFETFAPSYYWYQNNVYWRWKTPSYDQFMIAKWGRITVAEELADEEDVSQQTKNTLSQPAITNWDLEDGKIKLYVEAVDLGFSAVNISRVDSNGSNDDSSYVGTTITTSDDGKYKIFEYSIPQNGKYTFDAQLYNPLYESSIKSNPVTIYVGEYEDPETGEIVETASLKVEESMIPKKLMKKYPEDIIYNIDTDTYYYVDPETGDATPIDPTSKNKITIRHRPYLTNEKAQILTSENQNKLTV